MMNKKQPTDKKESPPAFAGFPTPKKNFFSMPNTITDIIADITNMSELKVIIYVIRHTWGFHEYGKPKAISVDEFMHGRKYANGTRMDNGTGLSHHSVIDGLKRAVDHGYLLCEIDDSDLARVKKSYSLKMTGEDAIPGEEFAPPEEFAPGEESTPQQCNNCTTGVKNLHHSSAESSDRSEKDTLERHSRKTLEEKQSVLPANESQLDDSGSSEPTRTHSQNAQIAGKTTITLLADAPRTCHLCGQPAEQRCTGCGAWYCPECQHPDHVQHPRLCAYCVEKRKDTQSAGSVTPGEHEPHAQLSTSMTTYPQQSAKVDPASTRRRQPKAPKVDPAEIQQYLDVFDRLFQEVTGNLDEGYICSGEDRKELTALLEANLKKPRYVTPEKLRVVYLRLWNKPKDERTGFFWQEHMKIKNVCKQYPQEAMTLSAQANQKAAKNATDEPTVSGLKRWTPPSATPARA